MTETCAAAGNMEKLVAPCFACHGKNGTSTDAKIPDIAGYSEDYFSYSLDQYQKHERPCVEITYPAGKLKGQKTSMCEILHSTSEQEIELMSQYFSRQQFIPAQQTFNPELAKRGEELHTEKCAECHNRAGTDPTDNAGILAGQKMDYLREQMGFVRTGSRFTAKKMRLRLENMSADDLEALVHYYGSAPKLP